MGYYFISIGGSGAKVMESLTHLCIAGAMPDRGKLNVLSIDPDVGNGNLERTSAALNNYDVFQTLEVGADTPLFKTKVSLTKKTWNPTGNDKTLDDLMVYQKCRGLPIGSLYEVLYTRKERATFLNEGFRGHPSIGAAVLAKNYALPDENSTQWTEFVEKVRQDLSGGREVKIFLSGSVFGGTGAAGIPTIARLLRDSLSEYGQRVSIGSALILPYFNFIAPEDQTNLFARSENFLTNTKAALKYYAQKDNVFNFMYFIGDSLTVPLKDFSPGSSTQKNDAHIVDFYAALAAIEFFRQPAEKPCQFKYICHRQGNKFSWDDFPALREVTENSEQEFSLSERFVKFTRFIFAYIHMIKPVLKGLSGGTLRPYQYPWFVDYFRDVNVNSTEVKNFEDYTESFVTWLKQLETVQDREISLIMYSMFTANPACLVRPDAFNSCDGQVNDVLTLHEVWYRLAESSTLDYSSLQGFGKFLRALYEAVSAKV